MLPEAGAERVSPVDFCNQNSPRAQPRTIRAPVETTDATHPACAGLGGNPPGGVGAPSASSTADSGRRHAPAYASTLRPRQRLLRDTSRASTSQGIVRRAANLSPSMTDVPKDIPRSTEIDRGLREADCVHLAGCARFERALPKPDPLAHLLSQNRPDAGWRSRHRRSLSLTMGKPHAPGLASYPARTEARLRYDGSATQTLTTRIACEHEIHKASDLRAPVRSACAGRPPRSTRCSRALPANRTMAVSVPLTRAESNHAIGTVERSSCSRGPTTQGLGLASLGAPRRATEIRDTRGAFHRSATCDIGRAFVQHAATGRVESTAFHQPVESTRRPFRLSLLRRP
jgi:hypothetical protein